jgi:hypothetical protein
MSGFLESHSSPKLSQKQGVRFYQMYNIHIASLQNLFMFEIIFGPIGPIGLQFFK